MAREAVEGFIRSLSAQFESLSPLNKDKQVLSMVPTVSSGTGWVVYHPSQTDIELFVPIPDAIATYASGQTIIFDREDTDTENTLISAHLKRVGFGRPKIQLVIAGELTDTTTVNPILQRCTLDEESKGVVAFQSIRTGEKKYLQLQPAPYRERFTMTYGTLVDRAKMLKGEGLFS